MENLKNFPNQRNVLEMDEAPTTSNSNGLPQKTDGLTTASNNLEKNDKAGKGYNTSKSVSSTTSEVSRVEENRVSSGMETATERAFERESGSVIGATYSRHHSARSEDQNTEPIVRERNLAKSEKIYDKPINIFHPQQRHQLSLAAENTLPVFTSPQQTPLFSNVLHHPGGKMDLRTSVEPLIEGPLDLRTSIKRSRSPSAERFNNKPDSSQDIANGLVRASRVNNSLDIGDPVSVNSAAHLTNIDQNANSAVSVFTATTKSENISQTRTKSDALPEHERYKVVSKTAELSGGSTSDSDNSESVDLQSSNSSDYSSSPTSRRPNVSQYGSGVSQESSSDEERQQQQQVVNLAQKETSSTKRVTNWSVSIFRRWMSESPRRAAKPELLKMTVPQINTFLCKFLVEARKSNGCRYPSKSLQALGQGLLRHVRNNRVYSHRETGSRGNIFRPVSQVLSMELRRTLFYEEMQGRTPKVRQKHKSPLRKRRHTQTSTDVQIVHDDTQNEIVNLSAQISTNGREIPESKPHTTSSDESSSYDDSDEDNGEMDIPLEKDADVDPGASVVEATADVKPSKSTTTAVDDDGQGNESIDNMDLNPDSGFGDELLASAVSTETNNDSVSLARCKSTQRNTKWAVHLFNNWREVQHANGNNIPILEEMEPGQVNAYLAEFIANVMKTDGTPYIPSCLYSLACGLLRHVRSQGRSDLDFMNSKDPRFATFQTAMTTRIKALSTNTPKERPKLPALQCLSPEEESKLWQYHVFGLETAKSLQYSVFYYNFKLFGIKAYLHHRSLQRQQFSVTRTEDENYVSFESNKGDNQGSSVSKPCKYFYEKDGSAPGSIVELYDVYLAAIGPSGPFYKRLLGLQGPTSRFSEHNLGIRSFQTMWTDIWEAASLD